MKRLLIAVLALTLVFSLAACGNKTKPQGNGTTTVADSEPTFSGVESKTIHWGSTFDPLDGVTATDANDGDITSSIQVTGTVDTFRSIQHELTYSVTNSQGTTATVRRLITVDYATEEDMAGLIATNDPTKILKYEYSKQNFYNVDFSVDGDNMQGGVPGWQSWGAGGSYKVHDGMMEVKVGTDYFQISNNENILKAGQYYIVEFKAKADQKQEDKALEFTFRAIWGTEANGGWDDHKIQYWPDKPIDTEWKTFYFLFKAKTDEENCLCLITQGLINTVYYKDIYIYEVNPTSDPLNIPEEVVTNYDLSSDNAEYWDKYSLDDNGTFTVQENLLTINVKDVYMQVANHRNKLDKGKSYKLEFDIESSVDVLGGGTNDDDFQYRVIVGSEEPGWDPHSIIYPTENLTANVKKHITVYFTTKYATKNVFCYIFQGFTGTIKISNVSVALGNPPADTLTVGTDWNFWSGDTADKLFDVENQVVTYNTQNPIPYYQISNNNNDLVANTKYKITFNLKPESQLASGQFKFIFGSENSGWNVLVDQVLNEAVAANATKELSYEFTAPADPKNVFCFIFMNYQGKAVLSDFVIEELEKEDQPEAGDLGTNWNFWSGDTADKLFTVDGQVVTYNASTAIPYYQISNNGNTLENGKAYTITFDLTPAQAMTASMFKFIYGDEEGGWHPSVDQAYAEAIAANTTAHLSFDFTATSATANAFCFIFMGYQGQAVLSNFSVTEKAAAPSTLGTNWNFWSGDTAEKLFTVENQVVTYNTTTAIPYYQISNNGNALENGKTYTVTFDLTPESALSAGMFKFIYGDENGGWHPSVDQVYNQAVEANATAHLTFEFTATSDTANAYCFIFMGYQGKATLSNIVIAEKE